MMRMQIRIDIDCTADKIPGRLRELRRERRLSQLQLADSSGVNVSVVHRAERGLDCRLSTWNKLFSGLGYRLVMGAVDDDEYADFLGDEADRRRERREAGLCAGKRRW